MYIHLFMIIDVYQIKFDNFCAFLDLKKLTLYDLDETMPMMYHTSVIRLDMVSNENSN